MYVDGNPENKLITGDKIIQHCPDPLMIGDGFDGGMWFPYLGHIDEVRVWNTAVDSITVKEWTHKKITPDHPYWSNLAGYWKFNEGAGSVAGDSGDLGNNGILTNMDTTAAWFTSTAPLATGLTDTLLNVSATWVSVDSNSSSIFSVEDNDISDDDCIIFGHSGADLSWIDTDVPENLDVINRLDRVWRMEVYGGLSGNIIFDVSTLGITDGDALMLLADPDNVFADADTIHGTYDDENQLFSVYGYNFKHGYYYTLGTSENLVSIEENDIRDSGALKSLYLYPSPFSSSATIAYELRRPATVRVTIYNHLGKQVAVFVPGDQEQGKHSFSWQPRNLQAGVYYAVLRTHTGRQETGVKTVKMIKLN